MAFYTENQSEKSFFALSLSGLQTSIVIKRTVRYLLPCWILFLAFSFSQAQLHWQRVDSIYRPLPVSIHVFRTNDSLDGSRFIAYYLSAKLKDKELIFTVQTGNGKLYTPSEYFHQEQHPLAVMNCGFFSALTNNNLSVIIKDGKLVSRNITALKGIGNDSSLFYYITRSAIGIDKKRNADVAWVFTTAKKRVYAFETSPVTTKNEYFVPDIYDLKDVDWKWWKMQTAVGGGPTLIHDGEIRITDKEEQIFPGEQGKEARTAMGYTRDNRLIILVIQGGANAGGATFEQEARILKNLGCYEALNLDGGANSGMVVNGKETILPSDKNLERPIAAAFIIRAR